MRGVAIDALTTEVYSGSADCTVKVGVVRGCGNLYCQRGGYREWYFAAGNEIVDF